MNEREYEERFDAFILLEDTKVTKISDAIKRLYDVTEVGYDNDTYRAEVENELKKVQAAVDDLDFVEVLIKQLRNEWAEDPGNPYNTTAVPQTRVTEVPPDEEF